LHLGAHTLTQPRAREKREQGGTAASINQQFQSRAVWKFITARESGEVRGALLIGAEPRDHTGRQINTQPRRCMHYRKPISPHNLCHIYQKAFLLFALLPLECCYFLMLIADWPDTYFEIINNPPRSLPLGS
jgi:hypothetical protein